MSSHLPARPSLSSLRKQAKSVLKNHRAGDPEVVSLVGEHHPRPEAFSSLRDAQLVVARQYGFAGWPELCDAARDAVSDMKSIEEKANEFCNLACLIYYGDEADDAKRHSRASRLLQENTGLATADIFAAAAASDVNALRQMVEAKPESANVVGGPRAWPPLMYLTYSRVPDALPGRDAVAAAKVLLDAGADPDSRYENDYTWTSITGAVGLGEQGSQHQPAHARARELVELLLDSGANPNDGQALYNSYGGDDRWLRLFLSRGLNRGALLNWKRDTAIRTLDHFLGRAAGDGLSERVTLLLEHGADAAGRDEVYSKRTHYENAMRNGHVDIANQLVEHGAAVVELSAEEHFRCAVMRGEEARARQLLAASPGLVGKPQLLIDAKANATATRLLLDLGVDPNAPLQNGRTALHEAAWLDESEVVELLLAAGAECDVPEKDYGASPIGFADHAGNFEMRDRLLEVSGDVFLLVCFGRADRLALVLAADPALASLRAKGGFTPLHGLETGGQTGGRVVDLLLRHGADINARTDDGRTPLAVAVERDDQDVEELLRSRGAGA